MKEIDYLLANMPTITTLTSELSTLLNNLPKDPVADLTITIGKSTIKLNRKKDEDTYMKFLQTVNDTSYNKIIALRDRIDKLLYNPDGDAEVKSM
jgi:hypothetical protein